MCRGCHRNENSAMLQKMLLFIVTNVFITNHQTIAKSAIARLLDDKMLEFRIFPAHWQSPQNTQTNLNSPQFRGIPHKLATPAGHTDICQKIKHILSQ